MLGSFGGGSWVAKKVSAEKVEGSGTGEGPSSGQLIVKLAFDVGGANENVVQPYLPTSRDV